MRALDLTEQRFGRLVAKTLIRKDGLRYWECLCDCGNWNTVVTSNLRMGHTQSCGCLHIELSTNRLRELPRLTHAPGIGSANFLMNRYVQGAKARGYEFSISSDIFIRLTSSNCYYCEDRPSRSIKGPRSNGAYTYNGVDRKDSMLGYTEDNCVACCTFCNYGKNRYSESDFVAWLNRIRERARK